MPSSDQGGALTNGVARSGSIALGDLDQFTFAATVGETVTVDIVEDGVATGFTPWIRLLSPTGMFVDGDWGATNAQIVETATETGTYTVIVGTADSGNDETGNYLVTVTR